MQRNLLILYNTVNCLFLSESLIKLNIFSLQYLMLSQVNELTPQAIPKMLETQAEDQFIIVQVLEVSPAKSGRLLCQISDGNFSLKAYLNDDSVIKPSKDSNAIICIKSHMPLKNSIGITNLKLVCNYPNKIGEPQDWLKAKENSQPMSKKQFKFERTDKLQRTQTKNLQAKPSIVKKDVQSTPGKSSDYDSIPDLHIGQTRWTTLCRITRKTLKQSKNGLKILEIELVDRSKTKIIGTFFGESATEFNDLLKQQSIYEISKGRLKEGNYNNSRNSMVSPYTLIFDSKSQFNEVSDVNIIVKAEETSITLGDLYNKRIFNQQFDVAAYVTEVKCEQILDKGDKKLTYKDIILADPEAQITMEARLWNWNQEFGEQMVGKVLIFNRFHLREYKGIVSMNSLVTSSITTFHNHPMKKYEGKSLMMSDFKSATERREMVEENTKEFCRTTKELAKKVEYMAEGDTIHSILQVWITRMALNRKWYYDGCPKCKKMAEKYSKCQNCGNIIENTTTNFILGVEVSDFFGSIWITAYDELSKKIFKDLGNSPAAILMGKQKDQLMEQSENYLYQSFRLKINTKKDSEGRIKHNAGRLYDIHQEKQVKDNIEAIKQMMA